MYKDINEPYNTDIIMRKYSKLNLKHYKYHSNIKGGHWGIQTFHKRRISTLIGKHC